MSCTIASQRAVTREPGDERVGVVRKQEIADDDAQRAAAERQMAAFERGEAGVAGEEALDVLGHVQGLRLGRPTVVMMRESATVDAQAQASSPDELAVGAELLFGHRHRAADVEHEIDARRDLLAVETDGENLGPRVGGPIDVAEIVAGRVGPIVLELQRAAGARAKPLADPPADAASAASRAGMRRRRAPPASQ